MSQKENLDLDKNNHSDKAVEENNSESAENISISRSNLDDNLVSSSSENKEEDNASSAERHKHKKKTISAAQKEFDHFIELLEKETDLDQRLKQAIEKMEFYLSQGGTPQFKYFWEIRKRCLDYFKENISPGVRSTLWAKFSELSKEARKLKEMFDEQSAFAAEQINMAIDALESELNNFDECIAGHENIDFRFNSNFLEKKFAAYNDIQKRLNLLNAQAARVNTLRKELIKVDMRIKQKNLFFQRLSDAGDKIFPLRKELIKNLSDQFIADVDRFIQVHFSTDQPNESVFFLREEIKALQGIAKILTLNTHSFTSTRLKLSEFWDKLKGVDKERKKERAEKKETFKQNCEDVLKQISEFKEHFLTGTLSVGASNKQLEVIQRYMRDVHLGRDEIKFLRDEIASARRLIDEKMKSEEEIRINEEKERIKSRKIKFDEIKTKVDELCLNAPSLPPTEIEDSRVEIQTLIEEFKDLSTREKNDLERPLKSLNDLINTKKEEALLHLSDDDQETLKNLREILKQRLSRRKEIKENYDSLRKSAGTSGFDIGKAFEQNQQINIEKERLDSADLGIAEIEEKIREIKKKIK